jgi:endonuclease G
VPARKPSLQLHYRPRLADLKPVLATPAGLLQNATGGSGARVTPAEVLQGRDGYAPAFLGDFVVPWPSASEAVSADLYPIDGQDTQLRYTHFSIAMSRARRMARWVGVNIDGKAHVEVPRSRDSWAYDGRLPMDAQIGDALYAGNGLDRGHLVRRQDPNWGPQASTANADTFHFTNCSPQMSAFNQKTWLELEDYILDNTQRWEARATVFTGPVFNDNDRLYRGVKIPQAYWKVVAYLGDDGKPSASAYMIDQSRELGQLDLTFGALRTYRRSVLTIEALTGLHFGLPSGLPSGSLSQYDGFSNEELATGTRIEALVTGPESLYL